MIFPIQYAQKTHKKVDKNIQTIDAKNQNYIFLGDYDIDEKCFTLKKEDLIEKYNHLDSNLIFIVKDEIESWFLAGINTDFEEFEELTIPDDTENVTKEMFNAMWQNSHFDSKIDFMMEISKSFDFDLAIRRNTSFKYFIEKLKEIM